MRTSVFLLCTLALALPAPAQDAIPVLVVSGANNHDWPWTTPSIASMLEESGRFEVTVTYEPSTDLARPLDGYAAIVLDYNGPRWGEAAEESFLAAVRGGTGVTVVHAADNAFPGWKEYEELVALLWRSGTGHGRFHPFDVTVVDREHPITATLPTLRQHPDELYHRLVHLHGAPFRVLATAYSDPETGGTGQDEPMILVQQYGLGRVFHTPMGHVWPGVEASRVSHADPQFRALLVRGTEWAATGRVTDGRPAPNTLSELERTAGWRLLFDGTSLAGWRAYGGEAAPEGWTVTSGCLHRTGRGGDLVTEEQFEDFELRFEWKLARGSNSGVKVRVQEREDRPAAIGLEYQLLDDAAFPDLPADQRTGSVYDVVPAGEKRLAPLTTFNESRILVRGARLEHWLNGERVLLADLDSEEYRAALAASKFTGVEDFGRGPGHVVLQDHGDEVWFRSIALRPLPGRDEGRGLLAGQGLEGWREVGDALWTREGDELVGRTGGGGQSFLISEETFGDFVLEVDLLLEDRGNSGIQVRSRRNDAGRVFGYQIEIDPSERSWSGGLYDEFRRGWLDDLSDSPAARAAFRPEGWNTYRIQCVGPWIRTWVNGVPAANHLDPLDLEGHIAFQVHSGNNTHLRWRDPRLHDLGRHRWTPWPAAEGLGQLRVEGPWTREGEDLVAAGPGTLTTPGDVRDLTLRLRIDPATAPLVEWRCRDDAEGEPRQVAPGILAGPSGWQLEPAALEGLPTGEVELTLTCIGPRLAVHAGGELLLDRIVRDASQVGPLRLRAGGPCRVASPARLLPVQR